MIKGLQISTMLKRAALGLVAASFLFGALVYTQTAHAQLSTRSAATYSSGGTQLDVNTNTAQRSTASSGGVNYVAPSRPSSASSGFLGGAPSLQDYIKQLQERVAALESRVKQGSIIKNPNDVVDGSGKSSLTPPSDLFRNNFGVGASGAQVTRLQECLVAQGYFKKADMAPIYGPMTRDAVKKFQAAKGIVSSGTAWSTGYGYVGPSTRAELNAACASSVNDDSTTSGFSVSPTSGKAPLKVTFKTNFAGFGTPLPKIYYGDGTSEKVEGCNAPADVCTAPGKNTHTYKKAGTYNVVVKDSNKVYHRKTITVKAASNDDTLPDDPEGEPLVDLKFRLWGEDDAYFDELPRKVVAGRNGKIKWETENVNNCRLTLAYDNDRVYKTIKNVSGKMKIHKVKPWDKLGLDYVQLTCEDENGDKVQDRIDIEFYSAKADYRLFIDGEEEADKDNITREEAMSRCLSKALSKTNKDKAVGCVLGEKIIYQHGDDPFPESLVRVIDPDEDTEVYDDGEDAENDEADEEEEEDDTLYDDEVVNVTVVKSGYKAIARLSVDGLYCGSRTGSQPIATLDWGDGEKETIDGFCEDTNHKQTNSHKYADSGIYKVTLTTLVGKNSDTESVSVGNVR